MDNHKIKNILKREVERHGREARRHKELSKQRVSKKQENKAKKHFHKRFQTKLIAEEMGFDTSEWDNIVKRQGLRISLDELSKLKSDLIDEQQEFQRRLGNTNWQIVDYDRKFQINIINKTPKECDTWEIEW